MKKIPKHWRAMADTKDLAPDQDTTKVYYSDNSDRIVNIRNLLKKICGFLDLETHRPELVGPLVRDLVSSGNQEQVRAWSDEI